MKKSLVSANVSKLLSIGKHKEHLTQNDIAELTGYSRRSVIDWKKNNMIPLDALIIICVYLNLIEEIRFPDFLDVKII